MSRSDLTPGLEKASAGFALAAILIGAAALVGWAFDIRALKSFMTAAVAMNPVTAACVVLGGLAVALSTKRPAASRLLGGVVLAVAALRVLGYLFGFEPGIDRGLFRAAVESEAIPNRMAPNTALALSLLALGLLLADVETRRGRRPADALALAGAAIGMFGFLGYLYEVRTFYGLTSHIPMALNTALAILALSIGALLARPDRGITAVIASRSGGGVLARRLLPAALVLPAVFGGLVLTGERTGAIPLDVGVSLAVVSMTALLLALVWLTAWSVEEVDRARREAEAERDRFFSLSPDLLCEVLDDRFLRLNSAWESILGFSREELLGEPFSKFLHPADRERTAAAAARLADGGQLLNFENRYRCKDGRYRWLSWSVITVPATNKIYSTGRDITQQREDEENLRRAKQEADAANRELEAFCYSVSHDLRAPLRSIDGFTRLFLRENVDRLDDKGRERLAFVEEATGRMRQMIEDLLELSRVTRAGLRSERVDLTALAHSVVEELRAAEDGNPRDVSVEIADGLTADGDTGLLRQVLQNLIGNAWKFTQRRPSARIEFGAREENGRRVFFVRDDGAGFDPAYAHKLFRVFRRLHGPSEFEGTGIGLATVARIIQRHGGKVWAEGAEDAGATFSFELGERAPEGRVAESVES